MRVIFLGLMLTLVAAATFAAAGEVNPMQNKTESLVLGGRLLLVYGSGV